MNQYQFFLCQEGDLFVTRNGTPVSSPYATDEFREMLSGQCSLKLEIEARNFENAIARFREYLASWGRQATKAAKK